jgi:hypothetical protein
MDGLCMNITMKINNKKGSQKMNLKNLLLLISVINTIHYTELTAVKVGFFINYLCVRGVEVSTFDYADFNETILGNESIILNFTSDGRHFTGNPLPDYSTTAREKFIKRFGKKFFDCATVQEMDNILRQQKVDILYVQKAGALDDKVSHVCKNAIHAVFQGYQIHGDTFACISDWLCKTSRHKNVPCVPYMVRLTDTKENLRQELGIPANALVFGRHGGADSFNIQFAKEAVIELARKNKDWYFLFLNTDRFCNLPNVIYLPLTADMVYKTKFVNTCDVMIHARDCGETFGLACAEFSIRNKPVITWSHCFDKAHIEILGNKGLYYANKQELIKLVYYCAKNIDYIRSQNWDMYSQRFAPEAVMKKFDEVFIKPLIK